MTLCNITDDVVVLFGFINVSQIVVVECSFRPFHFLLIIAVGVVPNVCIYTLLTFTIVAL